MTTPARELRDALAEALMLATGSMLSKMRPWSKTPLFVQDAWILQADRLLASLPSVKLKMGWEE